MRGFDAQASFLHERLKKSVEEGIWKLWIAWKGTLFFFSSFLL